MDIALRTQKRCCRGTSRPSGGGWKSWRRCGRTPLKVLDTGRVRKASQWPEAKPENEDGIREAVPHHGRRDYRHNGPDRTRWSAPPWGRQRSHAVVLDHRLQGANVHRRGRWSGYAGRRLGTSRSDGWGKSPFLPQGARWAARDLSD